MGGGGPGGGGGGGPWDKSANTSSMLHDMIKEMKVNLTPLTEIAPTPRNELHYNINEVPKHKVREWLIGNYDKCSCSSPFSLPVHGTDLQAAANQPEQWRPQ